MKKTFHTLLVVMIFVTAKISPTSAQSVESRPVSGFNRITCGEALVVHVKIDGTESLKIVTAPNISRFIETAVENGTLKIKFKDNLKAGEGNTDASIDIYVTAKSLSSIVKDGSGLVEVNGTVEGNDVNIVTHGSGNIQTAVKAVNLNIDINGAGNIRLSGTANKTQVKIVGPGQMKSHNLKTQDASVTITGAGGAFFTADKTIAAHVLGSGSVVYSGNAITADGSSNISKAD